MSKQAFCLFYKYYNKPGMVLILVLFSDEKYYCVLTKYSVYCPQLYFSFYETKFYSLFWVGSSASSSLTVNILCVTDLPALIVSLEEN